MNKVKQHEHWQENTAKSTRVNEQKKLRNVWRTLVPSNRPEKQVWDVLIKITEARERERDRKNSSPVNGSGLALARLLTLLGLCWNFGLISRWPFPIVLKRRARPRGPPGPGLLTPKPAHSLPKAPLGPEPISAACPGHLLPASGSRAHVDSQNGFHLPPLPDVGKWLSVQPNRLPVVCFDSRHQDPPSFCQQWPNSPFLLKTFSHGP